MVADAPRQLGPQAVDLRSNAQALLSDTVRDESSLLRQWSAIISKQACPRARVTQCGGEHAQRCWRGASMASRSRCSGRSKCKPKRTMVFARRRVRYLLYRADRQSRQAVRPGLPCQPLRADSSGGRPAPRRDHCGNRPARIAALVGADQPVRWISPVQPDDATLDQFIVVLQMTAPLPSSSYGSTAFDLSDNGESSASRARLLTCTDMFMPSRACSLSRPSSFFS